MNLTQELARLMNSHLPAAALPLQHCSNFLPSYLDGINDRCNANNQQAVKNVAAEYSAEADFVAAAKFGNDGGRQFRNGSSHGNHRGACDSRRNPRPMGDPYGAAKKYLPTNLSAHKAQSKGDVIIHWCGMVPNT